jgi:hypothetical protein
VIDVEPILGCKIALKRRDDRTCQCGATHVYVAKGTPPHAAALRCVDCDQFRQWLGEQIAAGMIEVAKRFGAPTTVVRNPKEYIQHHLGADAAMYLQPRAEPESDKMSDLTANDLEEMLASDASFFNGSDVPGKQTFELTVVKVTKQEFKNQDGSMETKPVLHFKENPRTLPLNKTNRAVMVENFGKVPKDWIGATLTLYGEPTSKGRGIRIRPEFPPDDAMMAG